MKRVIFIMRISYFNSGFYTVTIYIWQKIEIKGAALYSQNKNWIDYSKYKTDLSHQKDASNRKKCMLILKYFMTVFILKLPKYDTAVALFLHNSA